YLADDPLRRADGVGVARWPRQAHGALVRSSDGAAAFRAALFHRGRLVVRLCRPFGGRERRRWWRWRRLPPPPRDPGRRAAISNVARQPAWRGGYLAADLR